MYALIAGNQMCNYAVRLALPSLVQVASKELQLSDAAKAMLLSAHTPGYLLTQIPSGMLTQRLGAKRLLTLNTGGAALLLMLVPVAAARGGARGAQGRCPRAHLLATAPLNLRVACCGHCVYCSYGHGGSNDGALPWPYDTVPVRVEAPVAACRGRASLGAAFYQLWGSAHP